VSVSRYPSYLSTSECALYLGLTREKVRQEILAGELMAARYPGRRVRYRVEVESLRAYCARHQCDLATELLDQRYPPRAPCST
jgi:excisionase family DNA binding protein